MLQVSKNPIKEPPRRIFFNVCKQHLLKGAVTIQAAKTRKEGTVGVEVILNILEVNLKILAA